MNTEREFSAQTHITWTVEEFLSGISYLSASFSHYHKTSEIINLQGVHFESPFLRFRSVSTGHVSLGLRGGKNTWWSRTTPLTKLGVT